MVRLLGFDVKIRNSCFDAVVRGNTLDVNHSVCSELVEVLYYHVSGTNARVLSSRSTATACCFAAAT